jgi:hypothetical protein
LDGSIQPSPIRLVEFIGEIAMPINTFAFGLILLAAVAAAAHAEPAAKSKDERVFEMRTYYAAEGKLDALHARFRDHTTKLFEKHGMTNFGYWTPIDNKDNKLIYVLAYESDAAREKAWQVFAADPAWKQAQQASETNGRLVAKVESVFLRATDYSPPIEADATGDRVFELRVYTATKGNLGKLHGRFRDHTTKLFAKHGMTNVAYFAVAEKTPSGKEQAAAENTLVYFLAHKSEEAGKASFGTFRQDPDWIAAKGESEKDGSLTTMPDGVKSTYLKATDYSRTK